MTLDELIEWVDEAMNRLPRGRKAGERVKHARTLYGMIDPLGCNWELRDDWHGLAVKVAKVLKEPVRASEVRCSEAATGFYEKIRARARR
jgi:hypothetical protein